MYINLCFPHYFVYVNELYLLYFCSHASGSFQLFVGSFFFYMIPCVFLSIVHIVPGELDACNMMAQ